MYTGQEKELLIELYRLGVIKTWPNDSKRGWTLYGGSWSPVYINLRELYGKRNARRALEMIGAGMTEILTKEIDDVSRVIGVATAGIPLSTIITYSSGLPSCYTAKLHKIRTVEDLKRKIAKGELDELRYGEHTLVEGEICDGERLVLVDDIITEGSSKILAKEMVEESARERGISVKCEDVIVVLDREQGGEERLMSEGLRLHSLIRLRSRGLDLLRGAVDSDVLDTIKDYFETPEKYQDVSYRIRIQARLERS